MSLCQQHPNEQGADPRGPGPRRHRPARLRADQGAGARAVVGLGPADRAPGGGVAARGDGAGGHRGREGEGAAAALVAIGRPGASERSRSARTEPPWPTITVDPERFDPIKGVRFSAADPWLAALPELALYEMYALGLTQEVTTELLLWMRGFPADAGTSRPGPGADLPGSAALATASRQGPMTCCGGWPTPRTRWASA